jgi:hypothetical protein
MASNSKNLAELLNGDVTVTATDIADGSVTTAKLADSAVTDAKIEILDAISATIADTAVDIFVYDTSKDSDGGAWRKRTQHTSWYNETLNTATRGSRREFPSVAVIVAEATQVTIYDGDDPSLPMWMVFNQGSDYRTYLARTQAPVTSVSALNGVMAVGRGNAAYDESLLVMSFIEDGGKNYGYSDNSTWTLLANIANRNTTGIDIALNPEFGRIVNLAVNDVAMTVLPNAPIDSATGLPIPTIAVATNGGVSVIKDDGTVVDGTNASGDAYEITGAVAFDENNRLWYVQDNVSQRDGYVVNIPSSDWTANNGNNLLSGASGWSFSKSGENGNIKFVGTGASDISHKNIGSDAGVTFTDYTEGQIATVSNSPLPSLFAYVSSTYNTGWMNGDIKMATLSDTDDTDVTGSELITNGTFDSNISGWTASGSNNISWSSGTISVDRNNSTSFGAYQGISTVIGQSYTVSFDVTSIGATTTARLYVGSSAESNDLATLGPSGANTTGSFFGSFIATSTTTYIHLGAAGVTNGTASFDNVSVRLGSEDRSVNNKGLQVFGTVTKNPVATGADLVAYSGWSTSNYLMQPYNSDFDFGTESQCVTAWFKLDSATTSTIIQRGASDANQSLWVMIQNGNSVYFDYGGGSEYTSSSYSFHTGIWYHLVCHVTAGGSGTIYVNGKEVSSYAYRNNAASTFPNNTAWKTTVGLFPGYSDGTPFDGSIALVRVSGTVPSAEQIKKMYEDEKFLFQEGAQSTLYGSSDAVTALAYDEYTNKLHVGTSAGRSVFEGLRRVDNTTDAVGAAISAAKGMVAED